MKKADRTTKREAVSPLPWKYGEGVNRVVKCLIEAGPMTVKQLQRVMAERGYGKVQLAAINKILRTDLAGAVAHDDGKWLFNGDKKFTP